MYNVLFGVASHLRKDISFNKAANVREVCFVSQNNRKIKRKILYKNLYKSRSKPNQDQRLFLIFNVSLFISPDTYQSDDTK